MTTNSLLQAALEYRDAGLHPIPCEPRGKRPLVSWKQYQDEMPSADTIRAWWTLWPDANVALVLGRGMFAVDVDGIEGANALLAAGVPWGAEPCSRTSRGFHLFYAGTTGDRVGLLPKVDVRGVGYVIAPPSVHATGHVYRWERPIEGALPPAPPQLTALLAQERRPAAEPGAPDWFTQALLGVAEGSRDQTCTRLAGYLLGKGLPEEAVEVILQAWAERCTPPFSPDQVSKCVTSIARREGTPEGPSTLDDALDMTLEEINAPPERRKPAVATDLAGLDGVLAGGFQAEYILLGARPSVGKTALALQIARRRAKAGQGVLIVSREMTKQALARRLLAQESGVRAEALKTGNLIDLERRMLAEGAKRLRGLPMWITTSVRTTDQLADLLRTFSPGMLHLVVVDYLQLMGVARDVRDPRQRVEAVSKDIKALVVEHELPVLALSSLSRPPKDRPSWRPSLADLRESGELEHDADIVLLMHRDLAGRETELQVAKNRDGGSGQLQLTFDASVLTFTEESR